MINMMDYTQEITAYFDRLKVTIDKISKSDLSDLMNVLVDVRETDFHNGQWWFIRYGLPLCV